MTRSPAASDWAGPAAAAAATVALFCALLRVPATGPTPKAVEVRLPIVDPAFINNEGDYEPPDSPARTAAADPRF